MEKEDKTKIIKGLVTKWKELLYLGVWEIDIDYNFINEDNPLVIADTEARFEYLKARVTFYMSAIEARDMGEDELEKWVVHELVHIALAGTQSIIKNEGHWANGVMERENQLLTYALIGLERNKK